MLDLRNALFDITKYCMHLISRFGLISRWSSHWMYYNLHTYMYMYMYIIGVQLVQLVQCHRKLHPPLFPFPIHPTHPDTLLYSEIHPPRYPTYGSAHLTRYHTLQGNVHFVHIPLGQCIPIYRNNVQGKTYFSEAIYGKVITL